MKTFSNLTYLSPALSQKYIWLLYVSISLSGALSIFCLSTDPLYLFYLPRSPTRAARHAKVERLGDMTFVLFGTLPSRLIWGESVISTDSMNHTQLKLLLLSSS